ncbi:unnamed protein product, partial [Adineta steineri]
MATDHLDIVYSINERIKKLQEEIEELKAKSSRSGKAVDSQIEHRIENLNMKINELILERTRELKKVRWGDKRQPKPKAAPVPDPVAEPDPPSRPVVTKRGPSPVPVVKERVPTPIPVAVQSIISPSSLKVSEIDVGTNATSLTMVPTWFKPDNVQTALGDIVYPEGTTERDQFITVARYRVALGQSTNFIRHPLDISEHSTETLVLSLEALAQQFGGQLSFTNRDLSFENSAEGAACGVPNLGSAHLLANDSVPTAHFAFKVNLDYDKDLIRSRETMENFVVNFSVAIAQILGCKRDYVRVFAVRKLIGEKNVIQVNFGLTTPNQEETELLAIELQDMARLGFGDSEILRLIQLREYKYEWRSILSYLELKPSDFDPRFNFDYTQPGLPAQQHRANQPYFLPLGWYRHALNVSQKYSDDAVWLGHNNVSGEWPVAFHGTHSGMVENIAEHGLSIDAGKRGRILEEAIQQKGPGMNQPALYLTTHCDGGAEAYATTFQVTNGNEIDTFQVVFQCRVQPKSFTVHNSCVSVGHLWRVIDTNAVRPYESLFGCCDDCKTCCCGLCCTPCLFGQNAEKIDNSNCCVWCCTYMCLTDFYLCWVPHYMKRQLLRQKYNIREDPNCNDLLATIFCSPCALCQEARFLKHRAEQITDTTVLTPRMTQP